MAENKVNRYKVIPEGFPYTWVSAYGEDRYGLWVSFKHKGAEQVFRWIDAGEFEMGSPEDEPERRDDELQHKVILTRGFWMADTACTQELWEAVMGRNPGRFKSARNPVDSVSWEDSMAFIEKINSEYMELDLRLPSEAEWEYSCLVGTKGPFSFGGNITTDLANYNGENPYNKGNKGTYREKMVEVKSLPCNRWGLYEMHGNVWEWCSDWYGEYREEDSVDPKGSEDGGFRVLRGGSWFISGGLCRSACRFRNSPDSRLIFTGFRPARGHQPVGGARSGGH